MAETCVVHLVWVPLGPDPFLRFLEAYRRHPGGLEHRLVVLFNGARDEAETEPYRAALSGVPHEVLSTPAPMLDIPAYFTAVRALACDHLCFVNSYGRPLDPDWLAKLHRHAARPGVGLVGATGSWGSVRSATLWAHRWRGPYDGILEERWRPQFPRSPRGALGLLRLRGSIAGVLRTRVAGFPPFPAPHVRTNAFMLSRALAASLRWGPVRDKDDAYHFESGKDGLTRQVLARGLQALLVGADGEAYGVERWPESETFWQGRQANLLVADNQTDDYASADAARRRYLSAFAWGERARPA